MKYKLPKAIQSHSERRQVAHLKKRRRMKRIGSGAFASVYGRRNYRRVVKVGPVGIDNYLKYVRAIGLRNKNPYFPRLYDVKMRTTCDGDKFYMIEMERLHRWFSVPQKFRTKLLQKLGCDHLDELDRPRITDSTGKPERSCIKLLRKVWAGYSHRDIHHGNIMFRRRGRGYQLVYSDPVA